MITFVTCWYALKNKFNKSIYEKWISNFLTNVNNFYLVIYTDNHSVSMLYKYINNNPRIKVVLIPIHNFYNIKYKDIVGTGKSEITFDQVLIDNAYQYACEDADITLKLYNLFKDRMINEKCS